MTSTSTSVLWDSSTRSYPSGICPKINQLISFLYDPGALQVLELGHGESWVCIQALHKGSFDFPQPTGSPGYKPTNSQSQTLWGLFFPVQVFWAGEPDVELESLPPWILLRGVIFLPWVLASPHLCPPTHLEVAFSIYPLLYEFCSASL